MPTYMATYHPGFLNTQLSSPVQSPAVSWQLSDGRTHGGEQFTDMPGDKQQCWMMMNKLHTTTALAMTILRGIVAIRLSPKVCVVCCALGLIIRYHTHTIM